MNGSRGAIAVLSRLDQMHNKNRPQPNVVEQEGDVRNHPSSVPFLYCKENELSSSEEVRKYSLRTIVLNSSCCSQRCVRSVTVLQKIMMCNPPPFKTEAVKSCTVAVDCALAMSRFRNVTLFDDISIKSILLGDVPLPMSSTNKLSAIS